ncbi:V-type ATP synthase subunit D [Saccharopolyspora sp. ASAGF58]|uniref:V-type ATP synthase subunit D n=1 Tax=Saccharopolyspora sp. ASAGF58 TaxID=2719023 RepID=UPI001446D179|nr:V-type ATP synthase subunit D [Saccharopolyspora sp. ASAGF58]
MTEVAEIRVPPGRAGRLRLRRRLEVAERGAALLEQKLRALQQEEHRLAQRARTSEQEWTNTAKEAETWLMRAALLTGQRGLRVAHPDQAAEVRIHWTTAMGVRYPDDVTCTLPRRGHDSPAILCSAAVIKAEAAHKAALGTAVRHAVDLAALRLISAEVATTRQRVRMLRHYWAPRLRNALIATDLALEEQERAEAVLRRWAKHS